MRWFAGVRTSVAAVMLVSTVMTACGDDDDKAGDEYAVLAADADIAGDSPTDLLTYATKVLVETPLTENWLSDPNLCDMGASTPAVYFAPTFPAPGDATASCTMQASQVLFLNPVGYFCAENVGDIADVACLEAGWNLTSSSVTMDGRPLEGLTDREYDTPIFDAQLPDGNIFETEGGTTKVIGRGQVLLVEDMPVGEHTIELAGDFGNGEFAGKLTLALTVEDG